MSKKFLTFLALASVGISGSVWCQDPEGAVNVYPDEGGIYYGQSFSFQKIVQWEGQPPNCVRRVTTELRSDGSTPVKYWGLNAFASTKTACRINGNIIWPEYSFHYTSGNSLSFHSNYSKTKGVGQTTEVRRWISPRDQCWPENQCEIVVKCVQTFDLRALTTSECVDKTYTRCTSTDGDTSTAISWGAPRPSPVPLSITPRNTPCLWLTSPIKLIDVAGNREVIGTTEGYSQVEVRWTGALSPMPVASLNNPTGSNGSVEYLGYIGGMGNEVVHRWRYTAPSRIGSRTPTQVTIQINQGTNPIAIGSISLFASPIVLVHGMASSAHSLRLLAQSLRSGYSASPAVELVDYHADSRGSFTNPRILEAIRTTARRAIENSRRRGIAGDSVSVIGHSMGGLAGALYEVNRQTSDPAVARLITVGTPMLGSELAKWFANYGSVSQQTNCAQILQSPNSGLQYSAWLYSLCIRDGGLFPEAGSLLSLQADNLRPALEALSPGSEDLSRAFSALSQVGPYAIGGVGDNVVLDGIFRWIALSRGRFDTIDGLLGTENDTVVSLKSQTALGRSVVIPGVIHTDLIKVPESWFTTRAELDSHDVFEAIFCALGNEDCDPPKREAHPPKIRSEADLFAPIFDGRTRLSYPFSDLASFSELRQYDAATITVNEPPNCPIERVWVLPAGELPIFLSSAPFVAQTVPMNSGARRWAVVILCGGNRFVVEAGGVNIEPTSAQLLFDEEEVIVDIGDELVVPIVGVAGVTFDAYENAIVTSSNPSVANYDKFTHRLLGVKEGESVLRATLGAYSASIRVIVVLPDGDRIFGDSFDS